MKVVTDGKQAMAGPFKSSPTPQMQALVCSTLMFPEFLIVLAHVYGDLGLTELRTWGPGEESDKDTILIQSAARFLGGGRADP